MNAKKIMGAVLVALLAVTAFAGVAAAADLGTFFPSQITTDLTDGTWTSANGNQVVVSGGVIQAYSVVAGTYTSGDNTSYFTNPTATYKLNGTKGGISYPVVNGGNLYDGDDANLVITPLADVGVTNMLVTYPNGSVLNVSKYELNVNNLATGTYKVVAIFDMSSFVGDMDAALLFDTLNSFTFNVVKAEDATISANVDTAFSGEVITVDVVGKPGETYGFNLTNVDIALNQYVQVQPKADDTFAFVMPNNGKATFQLTINSTSANQAVEETDSKTAIIQLVYGTPFAVVDDGEIKIKISAPVVTATLEAPSYFITQNITVTGTSTSEVKAGNFKFNLSGTNIDEFTLFEGDDSEYNGKEWTADLYYTKKLDVGTYTIKIYQGTDVVASVPVALKQPFISIIEAPEVVVQNTDAEFLINAEAAAGIKAYFFGTNFYFAATDIQQKNKDALNEFTVTVPKIKTNNMSAGQYFVVFQHPMYDKVFNIVGQSTGGFYLNTSGEAGGANAANETFLFNATERQTANAAQALCDALDTQNVDDMYVKYSFFIVGEDESFTISDIPATVAQGETFTLSGVSTANAGKFVTVEMVSTAFAAVPKETVGSASFIAVTTKVADDGTWEITMDTSDLNVDEYSLSVACSGEDKPWKNVKINVVEAADEPEQPEQPGDEPEQPEEPVAPETPGFGALAALAGLGAVAVLLLRRE